MWKLRIGALVTSGVVALGLSSTAWATSGADANGGDVWVDDAAGQPAGPGHEMDPHLACQDIKLWGSGLSDSSGPFTIDGWPASGRQEVDYTGTWSYSGSKSSGQEIALISVSKLISQAEANGESAGPQGLHFKLAFSQDPQKYKTFWVTCGPASSGGAGANGGSTGGGSSTSGGGTTGATTGGGGGATAIGSVSTPAVTTTSTGTVKTSIGAAITSRAKRPKTRKRHRRVRHRRHHKVHKTHFKAITVHVPTFTGLRGLSEIPGRREGGLPAAGNALTGPAPAMIWRDLLTLRSSIRVSSGARLVVRAGRGDRMMPPPMAAAALTADVYAQELDSRPSSNCDRLENFSDIYVMRPTWMGVGRSTKRATLSRRASRKSRK